MKKKTVGRVLSWLLARLGMKKFTHKSRELASYEFWASSKLEGDILSTWLRDARLYGATYEKLTRAELNVARLEREMICNRKPVTVGPGFEVNLSKIMLNRVHVGGEYLLGKEEFIVFCVDRRESVARIATQEDINTWHQEQAAIRDLELRGDA